MRAPSWFDTRVSIGNIVTWVTLIGSVIWMAAEVRADITSLKEFRDETKVQMRLVADQRTIDREVIAEMKSDIRLIRQLLEQQLRQWQALEQQSRRIQQERTP